MVKSRMFTTKTEVMKTKFTLMTAITTLFLAGATVKASAQCGYNTGYARVVNYPPVVNCTPVVQYAPAYGYNAPVVVVPERREFYRDRFFVDRFDARVDHRAFVRDVHEMDRDRFDARHNRF
jgi:hypothetical protein